MESSDGLSCHGDEEEGQGGQKTVVCSRVVAEHLYNCVLVSLLFVFFGGGGGGGFPCP